MFNVLSLLLGLLSWLLPVIVLCRYVKGKAAVSWMTPVSFASCAAALIFQLAEFRRRAALADWAGIGDTADVTLWAAVILAVVAVLLNTLALHAARETE